MTMRVAIVHYWLVQMRGGERVLEHLCDMYPDADIFTHVVNRAKLSPKLAGRRIFTSWISRLPFATKHYQKYLPLMPAALEALDLSDYDLVISCEAGPAKGIITRPDAVHVTYCHSPMRYIWDQYHQYRRESGLAARLMMPLFAPGLRQWDMASAARSDMIMANSAYVAARVRKFWGREAAVVHPPIDTDLYQPSDHVEDEYLWAGQLIPYKLPDVAVAAFTATGRRLHVVGTGPMLPRLRAMAGPGIRFSERLSFDDLRRAYATCNALVFTSEEDFGMIPVEVMASGRPVIAYGRGGALESVIEGQTGLFYTDKGEQGLARALDAFEAWLPGFRPQDALARARDFAPARFREAVARHIAKAVADPRDPAPPRNLEQPSFFLNERADSGRAVAALREPSMAALS